MSLPKVTILIITFNQAEFIEETLDSALGQDYSNIEIVVADDGSTDKTPALIKNFAAMYPDKIIPLTGGNNLGITGNCNRGLQHCTGDYIALLGGDDVMFKNKISHQVKFMEKNPEFCISYHNLEVFNSNDGKVLRSLNTSNSYSGDSKGYVKRGCVNGGSASMIRATSIPINGFDNSMPVASDWFFWVQAMEGCAGKIGYIDLILGKYRRHSKNVTNSISLFSLQGKRDCITACARIVHDYPNLASMALYRLATIIRSMRHEDFYNLRLITSLKTSFQLKTLLLLAIYYISCGKYKP